MNKRLCSVALLAALLFYVVFGVSALTTANGVNGNVITVAKDGSGDYTAIQCAIDSITDSASTNSYTILIYPG